MYTVYRWVDDSCSELLATFSDESLASHFCVFYAMIHMISVDDLIVGYDSNYSFYTSLKRGDSK